MTLDISLSMSVFGISMLSMQSRSVLGHHWHHELYMIHCKGGANGLSPNTVDVMSCGTVQLFHPQQFSVLESYDTV